MTALSRANITLNYQELAVRGVTHHDGDTFIHICDFVQHASDSEVEQLRQSHIKAGSQSLAHIFLPHLLATSF